MARRFLAATFVIGAGIPILAAGEARSPWPDLPAAVSSLGAVECGGYLYIYGGHADKTHTYAHETTLGQFHRLNLRDRASGWKDLPGGPHLQGMNLVCHQGRIIRVGGMEPRNKKGEQPALFSTDVAAIYDPQAKTWSGLPCLPAPRSSHDVAVVGDRLFVIGGWRLAGNGTTGGWHNTALVLDLSAKKPEWTRIPQPFERRALTMAVCRGKIYVLGGLTPDGPVRGVNVYDPATARWSTGPEYPGSERTGFSPAACTLDDRLYLNTADGAVLRLNRNGDGWEKVAAASTPRVVQRLIPWESALLVVGGAGRKGNVATIESIPTEADRHAECVPAAKIGCWTSLHNGGDTSLSATAFPLAWSPTKGIAWSAALPGYGQSAPVTWNGHLYVTAIDGDFKETCLIRALDVESGKLVWERKFPAAVRTKNSYMVSRAAPTPVVDRDGVYALFESGDLRALTHDGRERWTLRLFDNANRKFDNAHGYGSSPTQTERAVVVLVDHRGPSYLLAVSKETGTNLWKTKRASRSSWTSPHVARVQGQEQIVVSSTGTVDGYDAETGALLWSRAGLTGNGIPSATVQGDRIFIGAGTSQRDKDADSAAASNCCLRIQPNCKQGYAVVWKAKKALSHYVSPLVHRGRAYFVNQVGVLYCLDANTGEELYAKRTCGACWAEPIGSGDYVYLFHKDGRTTVIKEGDRFDVVAVNRLWPNDAPPLPGRSFDYEPAGPADTRPRKPAAHYLDPIVYAVAGVDGAFYFRLGTHLYCVRGSHERNSGPALSGDKTLLKTTDSGVPR